MVNEIFVYLYARVSTGTGLRTGKINRVFVYEKLYRREGEKGSDRSLKVSVSEKMEIDIQLHLNWRRVFLICSIW